MAFIVAGIIVVATLLWAFLQLFASGMGDVSNPDTSGVWWTLGIGLPLAALIVASHWFHFTW